MLPRSSLATLSFPVTPTKTDRSPISAVSNSFFLWKLQKQHNLGAELEFAKSRGTGDTSSIDGSSGLSREPSLVVGSGVAGNAAGATGPDQLPTAGRKTSSSDGGSGSELFGEYSSSDTDPAPTSVSVSVSVSVSTTRLPTVDPHGDRKTPSPTNAKAGVLPSLARNTVPRQNSLELPGGNGGTGRSRDPSPNPTRFAAPTAPSPHVSPRTDDDEMRFLDDIEAAMTTSRGASQLQTIPTKQGAMQSTASRNARASMNISLGSKKGRSRARSREGSEVLSGGSGSFLDDSGHRDSDASQSQPVELPEDVFAQLQANGQLVDGWLRRPNEAHLFLWFLRQRFTAEYLAFWLAADQFKQISDQEQRRRAAQDIYTMFFVAGSEFEVGFPPHAVRKLYKKLVAGGRLRSTMFDNFQTAAGHYVLLNLVPAFVSSDEWTAYRERHALVPELQLIELKQLPIYPSFAAGLRSMDENAAGRCASKFGSPNNLLSIEAARIRTELFCLQRIPITAVLSDASKIFPKLHEPGMKLLSVLQKHAPIEHTDRLAQCLVRIFDSEGAAVDLLRYALQKELTTEVSPNTIFREDRLSFRLISQMLELNGRPWIRKALRPIVDAVRTSTDSYEINPTRLQKTKDRPANVKRLRQLAQAVIEALLKSADSVSSNFRIICCIARTEVANVQPSLEIPALAALVFLRFLCPALCFPQRSGLSDDNPSAAASRGLILVAKILQSLSVNSPFEENFMSELGDIIPKYYPQIRNFLLSLSSFPKGMSYALEKVGPKQEAADALQFMHDFLKTSTVLDGRDF